MKDSNADAHDHPSKENSSAPLKRDLSFFDLTNIVVGAIVGSDIYIASAITAGLIGPFSIVAWIVAGLMATVLALVFAYSAYYVPRVGGSFAFVSAAFDDFYGFLAGWSMWIAEVLSLPVFALTFTNYLQYFTGALSFELQLLVKTLFVFGLTYVNIRGVKAAGRINDVLTIAKLLPLLLIVILGIASAFYFPGSFFSNYSPFAPFGFGNFGTALVLIFWAYVGFELGTLPSAEVKNPRKTVPRALITGMAIVIFFYLTTNFVIFGTVSSSRLATTLTPLLLVGAALLGGAGAVLMSAGALVSVSGSDESGVLGTARLSYAMSIDGLFPKAFSKVHRNYGTPYLALLIQAIIALGLSFFSSLPDLISFSVFNLGFSFLLVSLSLAALRRKRKKELRGERVLPWLGVVICLYLIYYTSLLDKILGAALILLGIPLYVYFSPKVDIHDLKQFWTSESTIIQHNLDRENMFLANLMRIVRRIIRKRRTRKQTPIS
jgi:basic amino acid/polyamine antiporter, APA family